jgi:hypothetical protein
MLQEIMGHASITTTLDLHGHLYPGEMDRYTTGWTRRPRTAMRPKCAQMTTKASKTRDSNPQPSGP